MYLELKLKKMPIILGSIIITASTLPFSGFATKTNQSMIYSSEVCVNALNDPAMNPAMLNEINNKLPKKIRLNTPGNYKFIGASATNFQNLNEIYVKANDQIIITGSGDYNITMDNVNIDFSTENDSTHTPLKIKNNANVKLILQGENTLKGNLCSDHSNYGIYVADNSTLTITGANKASTLDLSGKSCGILGYNGSNVIIKNGKITSNGKIHGICIYEGDNPGDNSSLIIEDGEISTFGETGEGICSFNMQIDGGELNTNKLEIIEKLTINEGVLRVTESYRIKNIDKNNGKFIEPSINS